MIARSILKLRNEKKYDIFHDFLAGDTGREIKPKYRVNSSIVHAVF